MQNPRFLVETLVDACPAEQGEGEDALHGFVVRGFSTVLQEAPAACSRAGISIILY